MFKDRNRRFAFKGNLTQTSPVAKKKDLQQKRRNVEEPQPMVMEVDQSDVEEKQMMHEARVRAWERSEITSQRVLHKQDKILRHHLLTVLLFDIQPIFNFKLRTIEHTIKILDLYESRREVSTSKGSKATFKRENIYPDQGVLMIDLVTCLFLSAKYNEIYPPTLYDLTDAIHCKCRNELILRNEFSIVESFDLNMNVALPSDWFKLINHTLMPIWAYLCYLDYDLKDKSKTIVEEINLYIEKVLESKDPLCYELTKLHEKSKRDRKFSLNEALKLYNAFVEFRLSRKISNMKMESSTKDNDQSKSSRTITVKSIQAQHNNNI